MTSTSVPLLSARSLRRSFGGVKAVQGCSLNVERGSITGLIGPNGSGKTTVFNIVTGFLVAQSGEVFFNGNRLRKPEPRRLYRSGLTRTFQQARIFGELSVLENLVVCANRGWRAAFGRRISERDRAAAMSLLDEFGIAHLAQIQAAQLSYGQRKLLDFASILMSEPQLVLLDEPTAGVNPIMIATMERHIRELHAKGMTFLIVEHDMSFVMRLCDPVVVLDRGECIMQGSPEQVQSSPEVLEAYLGD
jgi:neutral amino acid transport system ATP-binding protein